MVRIYLTHFQEDYAPMNEAYRTFWPEHRLPARTCIGTSGHAYNAPIEIDLVSRRPTVGRAA